MAPLPCPPFMMRGRAESSPVDLGEISSEKLMACAIPSFRLFAKHKTTISPFTPSETSALVTDGMYRYSRNPMYLGLVFLTIAATIFFGTWLGVVIVVAFIFLLNFLQIIPEEEALHDIFGEEYVEYSKKVRRWI